MSDYSDQYSDRGNDAVGRRNQAAEGQDQANTGPAQAALIKQQEAS